MKTWPTKKLGEVCEIYQPQTITSSEILKRGPFKVFGANGVIGFYSKYNHENAEVLVTCRGATCGTLNMSEPKSWITGNAMVVHPKDEKILLKNFLYYALKHSNLLKTITGTGQPQITRNSLAPFKISFPPLQIQKQIVERLDAIKKAQELNNKQIELAEELFQSLLHRELDPKGPAFAKATTGKKNWEVRKMGDVCEKTEQGHPRKFFKDSFHYIDISSIDSFAKTIKSFSTFTIKYAPSRARKLVKAKDTLFATTRPYLENIAFVTPEFDNKICSTGFCVIRANEVLAIPEFLFFTVTSKQFIRKVLVFQRGASYPAVSDSDIFNLKIPLPPIEAQQKIVEKLSAVQNYKKKLLEQKQKLQELFESVLNKSFKGEIM